MADASIIIRDWSGGQNNEYDPRSIMPSTSNEEVTAEGVLYENMEPSEKGSLTVSTGFRSQVSLGTNTTPLYIGEYIYNYKNHYLVSVSNDKIFYLRKATILNVHDCDVVASPTYGTWTSSASFGAVSLNTSSHVRGVGAITATINANPGTTVSTLQVTNLTSVDLSTYSALEILLNTNNISDTGGVPAPDAFNSVSVRIGTDATNYYEYTFSAPSSNSAWVTGWNGMILDLSSLPAPTGSPTLSAITYLQIRVNHDADIASTTVIIDGIVATKSATTYTAVDITGAQWTASETVTQNIVNGVNFVGTNSTPYLIIANNKKDLVKVSQKGTGILITEAVSGAPKRTHIVAAMAGFLFIAYGQTVYHTASEDETDWSGGTIGFNGYITGLIPTLGKELLVSQLSPNTEAIDFVFDDAEAIYFPRKSPFTAGIGALSHKSVQQVYNDSIFLGNEGVAFFGQIEAATDDNRKFNALSWKIDKVIRRINLKNAEIAASYYLPRKKEYAVATPLGIGANVNNYIFVNKTQYSAWITRTGFNIVHATRFREEAEEDIWFCQNGSDNLFKFTRDFDYNNQAYTRRWKSKIFHMDAPILFKSVPYIEIAGAMPRGCEFYVIITSDGSQKTFKVTDSSLLTSGALDSDGYIGDELYGDEYFGGGITQDEQYQYFRFYQRIHLPRSIIEGREFQFEIYQRTTGQPFKVDLLKIRYSIQPEAKVPDRHINSEIVTLPS